MKLILLVPILTTTLFANPLKITSETGQTYFIEEAAFAFWKTHAATGQFLGHPRDFYTPASQQDRGDIRYILTTLANRSLISIASHKGALQAAGDRIDHLHPLEFLTVVFTNEELKVAIRNVRKKGWVWDHFIKGIKECLETEASIGNMSEELVRKFSKRVKIPYKEIGTLVQNRRWTDFINTLIVKIPRDGDHGRYDT